MFILKLDVHLNIDLSDEIKRKRFVCCLCYNKMRRDYKSKNKNDQEKECKYIKQNFFVNKINNEPQDIFERRPTAQEHAAEIAKLIPPSLANLYKVVTEDEKDDNKVIKEGHCDGNIKNSKIRKHKPSGSSSDNSNSSDDSSSDSSSSTSSSDSSDSENDHPIKSIASNTSSYHIKDLPAQSTTKEYKYEKKDLNVINTTKHNNFNKDLTGISTSRHRKGTDSLENSVGDAAMDIIKNGVCNLCGLAYSFRPKSFWNSLDSPMPSVTGVTVLDALKILDSKLAAVSANVRKKKFVCKLCYAKICNGFRSQIIQRIAEKKGIAVDQLEASKLKVKGMDSSLRNSPIRKINGTCGNKFENRSLVTDAAKKGFSESHHKKKSKNKDKHHHAKKHKEQVKFKLHDRTTDRDIKLNSRSDHRKAVFKFTKKNSDHINSPKIVHDMSILKLINKSRHLQYKGKVVVLYNVFVNVVEIKDLLPSSAFKNEPVRLELLKNVHLYSNLYRNLKNRTGWSICILCHKTKLLLKETTHWLEDPVAPPNLMVPLRWAQLSLVSSSSPPAKPDIAMEDGKVCPRCHKNLAEKFGRFVGAKVAVSHGLSSEKIVLDKYKVSFDSNAMNIIADPLERVVAVKESTKRHKIGPKSKRQEIEYYIPKHDKTSKSSSSITDESVIPASGCKIPKVDVDNNHKDEFFESQDNVSLDLALSESSDSENDAIASDHVVSKLGHETESICKKSCIDSLQSDIPTDDIPTEKVPTPSSTKISTDLTESTIKENSNDAKVGSYNRDCSVLSKIDSNNINKNVALVGNNDKSAYEDNSEITSSALNSTNEIQSGESMLKNETSLDGFSDKALPLEKLNKTLMSCINNFECTSKQVKDNAKVCQNSANSKSNPDSNKIHESKDGSCNEDSDSEAGEHTTKQINLSKIMHSLSASDVKNQVNDQAIDNSGSTYQDMHRNVEVSEANKIDIGKVSTTKESSKEIYENELENRISSKSTLSFESNCNSENHVIGKRDSDTSISNCNNKSGNLNIQENEILSCPNTNDNCVTSAILENDKYKTTLNSPIIEVHNVATVISDSLIAKDVINVHNLVTSSCNANEKDNSNKLITANAEHETNVEDRRLSEFILDAPSTDTLNKTDENCKNRNSFRKVEVESVENSAKQTEVDNINEHCMSDAVSDIENSTKSQIDGETWLVVEKVISSAEISTESNISFENSVGKKISSECDNGPVIGQSELKSCSILNIAMTTADKGYSEMTTADLGNSEMTTADLGNSEMTTADLGKSEMTNADLGNCEMTTADLGNSERTTADKDDIENKTTNSNTGCCLEVKDKVSDQVASKLEVRDQQDTQIENDNHNNVINDKDKPNSLTSPPIAHKWNISEALIDTTDIPIKTAPELNGDRSNRTIVTKVNAVSCASTVDETMNNGSLNKKDFVSAIKHLGVMGGDVKNKTNEVDVIFSKQHQHEVGLRSNSDYKVDARKKSSNEGTDEDIDFLPKKSIKEVGSEKENLSKCIIVAETNNGDSKRKYEDEHIESEILFKSKKQMKISNHVEKDHLKTNSGLSMGNDICGDDTSDKKLKVSIAPHVIKESNIQDNENNLSILQKNTTIKPTKRSRALARNKKRSTVSNKTQNKCLSELIDKEKATSVDVVTDYLNSQREKIKELIKPISSEEIHYNAKTCVETVSENLMKIRSKLDKDINRSINSVFDLSMANTSDHGAQHESSQDQIDNQDLGLLSLESDPLVEDIGENTVAPFAQRKKCRGRPPNTGSDQDSYGSTTNTEKDSNSEEVATSCVLNIWQSIQGVSLDDLLTKDIHQPLKIQQYNVGVVLTLNDLRNLIGASLEDLVSWLQKLIPLELSEKGLKPSTEKIAAFIFSLNNSNMTLDPKKWNEQLSEDLFQHDKSVCNLHQEEANENMCFVEDIMDESINVKDREIRWDDYLAPVNLDNLLKGKESRVTWEQFNNGLLYALWKVNNLLHGDEENFVKWLSLTSTTPMKASDYYAMAKAVIAIDKHLVTFPEEISKLIAPIVVKSDKETPIKKILPRNKSAPNVRPAAEDKLIFEKEKTVVKSSSKINSLSDKQEQKKRPLCDRLNEALNNNSRKQSISPSNSLQPPSKKTARVLPQPSQEWETTSLKHTGKSLLQGGPKDRKVEESNKKYGTISDQDKAKQKIGVNSYVHRLKNNRSASLISKSSSNKISTRSKNKFFYVSDNSSVINNDPVGVSGQSSSEDRVPEITKVTSFPTTKSLPEIKHQSNYAAVNIENENINVYNQPSLMSNESLQAQIQYALINQAKIPIGDSTSSNLPHINSVDSHNMTNFNTSGVPMIPIMSASGYVTMIPLSMGIPNLPSSPMVGNPLPYNLKTPSNLEPNLPYTRQNFSTIKENPKEKELECKVSDLEKQLQEIQRQNSQLFELNKKLLKKTTNTEDPQVPKGLSKIRESSHYNDTLVPSSLRANEDSLHKSRPRRGRPRKDAR